MGARKLKDIAKRIPGLPFLYHRSIGLLLRAKSAEGVFTEIFSKNRWGGADSVSGKGSDVHQTRVVIRELPLVLRNFRVRTVLDIPCGDFHWMKYVPMDNVNYIGGDIVGDLIDKNAKTHGTENRSFRKLNLLQDTLPRVDMIFCRDCLVHFSYKDIFVALKNICSSHSTYLLTTTFPSRQRNYDIATGQWRPLNIEAAPFSFPPPIRTINEACTQDGGAYKDKSLGLWHIADIGKSLAARPLSQD